MTKDKELKSKRIVIGKDKGTGKEIYLNEEDRKKHLMIVGPAGSGKTSQTIMPLMFQDIKNENVGVTLIQPRSDLGKKIHAMAKYHGRKVLFFDAYSASNALINPLMGDVKTVIENVQTAYSTISSDLSKYFLNVNSALIKAALTVLKAVNGNETNLVEFNAFIHNEGGFGLDLIAKYDYIPTDSVEQERSKSNTISWLKDDYFAKGSELYEHCSDFRNVLDDLVVIYDMKKMIESKNKEEIDFDKHLENGDVVIISTDVPKMSSGFKLFNQLVVLAFQSAVFRRKCEGYIKSNNVYIDEFQLYSNPSFIEMMARGAAYNISLHLAIQTRASMGVLGRDIENIEHFCSNIILYPGVNISDAKYYSKKFGEVEGEPAISVNDIIFGNFGETTCVLAKNGKMQLPVVVKSQFIPNDLSKKIDQISEEYAGQKVS